MNYQIFDETDFSITDIDWHEIIGIIGPRKSEVALKLTNDFKNWKNLTMISYGITANDFSSFSRHSNFLRTIQPNREQAIAVARII